MTQEFPQAFVHRVTKGYKRLFFNVSLPLDAIQIDDGTLVREPETVNRQLAEILDQAFGLKKPPL